MTDNKQMVSVPRELLQRVLDDAAYLRQEDRQAIRDAIAAPAEDVRAMVDEPFFYALCGPDGKPHYEELCVSSEPHHLEPVDEGVTVIPLYRHSQLCSEVGPQCSEQVRIQAGLFPAVLPHPPRHWGFLEPDCEVPGYTIEQMKEYGATCVAAFTKQNGERT